MDPPWIDGPWWLDPDLPKEIDMDEQTVKAVFMKAAGEFDHDKEVSLQYKIRGAMQQLAAKRETRLAAQKEIDTLDGDIGALQAALDECEKQGTSEYLDEWYARRQDGPGGGQLNRTHDTCGRDPGRSNPAVQIDVRG